MEDIDKITDELSKLSINENIIKIQKWYRGSIFRLKRLPLILYEIQNYLKSQNIEFSNKNEDGRINSCTDEDEVIRILTLKFNDKIKKPKSRMWYDILVYDNLYNWIPVNIKTTTTLTCDNTGNLAMCVYSYTDENLNIHNDSYKNGKMSTILFDKIKNKKYNKNPKKDYYFIVLNKTNKTDIIINSVKGLSYLTANINNLPFQVCWNKNREFIYKKINERIKQFIDCLQKPKPSWQEIFISNIRTLNNLENKNKELISMKKTKNDLGQYFTTNNELKEKVYNFIMNNPTNILEPSIGRGHLINYVINKLPNITFDMYEIDNTLKLLDNIDKDKVVYDDFIKHNITKKYKTIIGNPPYIKQKKNGNLYIQFIKKCYDLLDDNGELIFIIPSDFFKLTSSSKLLNDMLKNGVFTHIYHPESEKLFENASINIIVFRYCKNKLIEKKVLYNDKSLYIINNNGLITFNEKENKNNILFNDYFDIYVGIVSGKDEVYKNNELGNIDVLNNEGLKDKYIYIQKYPCGNEKIDKYLLTNKNELINRKIKKFNENNWFEWGAPRNIKMMINDMGKDCIYVCSLTRKSNISFVGKIGYFGGGLIILKPKKSCDLNKIVSYLNTNTFKNQFMFSGRFKIGHRQISNSYIPNEYIT